METISIAGLTFEKKKMYFAIWQNTMPERICVIQSVLCTQEAGSKKISFVLSKAALSLSLVSVLDRYAIAAEHLDSKTLSRN